MPRGKPCLVLLALALASPAFGAETLSSDRARMYARPSKETWQAVLDTLAELKLKAEKIDQEMQVVVTRPVSYAGRTMKPPEVPGYLPEKFRLHLFVSPFAEPARVHLGSISEMRKHQGGTATLYNGGVAEEWFLAALERRLGQGGRPIPAAPEARAQLARELTGQEPCPQQPSGDRSEIAPPKKIAASQVEVQYPARAKNERSSGPVVLSLNVGEDGAVYGVEVLKLPDPTLQFREAAVGAVSLVRYAPARVKGCPVTMVMSYTVNYKLR